MHFQLDLATSIQVYIFQPIIAFIFLIIAIKTLKNNRKRLNISFSMFCIFIGTAVIINIIYSIIKIELIVVVLNYFTNVLVTGSPIFLYSFNMLILKSDVLYPLKSQLKETLFYFLVIIMSVIFYFFDVGVTINESTNWIPNWHLYYFVYMTTSSIVFSAGPIIISSIKLYKRFQTDNLKRKWTCSFIGFIGLMIYMYGAFINHFFNNSIFRFTFSLFGLSVVLWLILVYYGIGKQIA